MRKEMREICQCQSQKNTSEPWKTENGSKQAHMGKGGYRLELAEERGKVEWSKGEKQANRERQSGGERTEMKRIKKKKRWRIRCKGEEKREEEEKQVQKEAGWNEIQIWRATESGNKEGG